MKLKLLEKRDEAKGTKSFFWESNKPISFLPGQYLYLTLPKLAFPDPKGATRHFTISSSPTEGSVLRITTRIREESGYKKTLDALPIGSVIDAEGPEGTFVFDENESGTQIFIAGGIGITPFKSMIKYAADKNLTNPIYLIYSNSDADIAFKKEFDATTQVHQNIKVQYIVTSVDGRLDELKIEKFTENWKLVIGNCTFWLCGPPAFNDAMEQALEKLNISSGRVRSEKFTGY